MLLTHVIISVYLNRSKVMERKLVGEKLCAEFSLDLLQSL